MGNICHPGGDNLESDPQPPTSLHRPHWQWAKFAFPGTHHTAWAFLGTGIRNPHNLWISDVEDQTRTVLAHTRRPGFSRA